MEFVMRLIAQWGGSDGVDSVRRSVRLSLALPRGPATEPTSSPASQLAGFFLCE